MILRMNMSAESIEVTSDGRWFCCDREMVIEDCRSCVDEDGETDCFAFRCSKCAERSFFDCEGLK